MEKRLLHGIAAVMLALGLVLAAGQTCAAAQETVTFGMETREENGRLIVDITVADNPGMTSLGLRMDYDAELLTFESAIWSSAFDEDGILTQVSDITTGSNHLNISMVDDKQYTGDGQVVSIAFRTKGALSDSAVRLTVEDVTGANSATLTARVTDAVKGDGAAGVETTSASEAQNDGANDRAPGANGGNASGRASGANGGNASGQTSGAEASGDAEDGALDESFQTGEASGLAYLWGIGVASAAVVLLGLVCLRRMAARERNAIRRVTTSAKR